MTQGEEGLTERARTCGDEVIHDVDIERINEVNALGVDAVLR